MVPATRSLRLRMPIIERLNTNCASDNKLRTATAHHPAEPFRHLEGFIHCHEFFQVISISIVKLSQLTGKLLLHFLQMTVTDPPGPYPLIPSTRDIDIGIVTSWT